MSHISFFINLLVLGHFLQSRNCRVSGNPLPIDTIFKLPSPLPTWPPGGGFATGEIDLGGLRIRQVSTFQKLWTAEEGGPDGRGATFFDPDPVPAGFSVLGSYAQPNTQPLFGWVLVGTAAPATSPVLENPIDYTLVLAYNNSVPPAYFWLPTPPNGYKPVGYTVTATPEKPPLDRIRCVRSDFTDETEPDGLIWTGNAAAAVSVYGLRPKIRGANSQSLSVGTFVLVIGGGGESDPNPTISCLKNKNKPVSSAANPAQIQALFEEYAPYIYFHSEEGFLPSSVNWFFNNGALLYTKGQEGTPAAIHPNGTNLPQGGENDGLYWMDLPLAQQAIKRGNLDSAEAYLHAKSVLGGTFTDIQVWIFYPFNGHSTAKLGFISKINLGKIGEHVGDWEHVTLRISNFDGTLHRVFFSQHSNGQWVDSPWLEFQTGNKFVSYSALNSHASYHQGGLHLHGGDNGGVGVRDDTGRSSKVWDAGTRFQVLPATVDLPWLNYCREWGPNRTYDIGDELNKVEKFLPRKLKSDLRQLMNKLPPEVFAQQGPTGPKMKNNWNGEEVQRY